LRLAEGSRYAAAVVRPSRSAHDVAAGSAGEPGQGRLRAWTAWSLALALVAALLAVVGYESRDPDSALYARFAAKLAERPLDRWIAPEWWGYAGREGLFREHPIGLFVPGALVARLGYPAAQAAYLVNALYQVLTIALVGGLAARFVPGVEARALTWLLQFLPIAFAFRVRANHEQAVLMCVLAALYGIDRARHRPGWVGLTGAALVGLLLVKGLFVLTGVALCAWLLLVRDRSDPVPAPCRRAAWAGLVGAVVVAAIVAVAYEALYRRTTGESFAAVYLGRQLGVAAAPRSDWGAAYKLYNAFWYLVRVLWFAFPWSPVALVAGWTERRRLVAALRGPARPGPEPTPGAVGLVLALGVAALYVALFSLSDRKAERYIFPAYFFAGGAGAVAAIRQWPTLRAVVERLDRWFPWIPVGVWLGGVGLRVATGWLPRVKVWAPE
jgi:4-amino-4-deoxy-L-arabinose transferase-like glycosyltransferase